MTSLNSPSWANVNAQEEGTTKSTSPLSTMDMEDGADDSSTSLSFMLHGEGQRQNDDYNHNHNDDEKTTVFQSLLHLVKGYIGPGCLSLPWAFSKLGIPLGCFAVVVLSAWTSYNCWIVLTIKRWILAHPNNNDVYNSKLTYPDVAEWAYGLKFQLFVKMCICILQLSICTVFLSFIGENTTAVVLYAFHGDSSSSTSTFSQHAIATSLCMPAIIALSCIPNLKRLSPVTSIATAAMMVAFGMLGITISMNWNNTTTNTIPSTDWSHAPLALCAILYSNEGICLILPIEHSMKHPQKFKSTFVTGMIISAIVFASVATLSVLAFGQVENGSITAFLLESSSDIVGKKWVMGANALVTFSVLMTYPLQLYPCFELIGPWWGNLGGCWSCCRNIYLKQSRRTPFDESYHQDESLAESIEMFNDEGERVDTTTSTAPTTVNDDSSSSPLSEIPNDSPWMRLTLVLITYTIAIVVPNVQTLISLAGAIAGSSTALLIPPLLEYKWLLKRQEQQLEGTSTTTTTTVISSSCWSISKCRLSFVSGFIFCLIGATASLTDIIKIYQ